MLDGEAGSLPPEDTAVDVDDVVAALVEVVRHLGAAPANRAEELPPAASMARVTDRGDPGLKPRMSAFPLVWRN